MNKGPTTLSNYVDETNASVTFDLHYHTNVYRYSKAKRDQRLALHRKCLEETNVDFVAST